MWRQSLRLLYRRWHASKPPKPLLRQLLWLIGNGASETSMLLSRWKLVRWRCLLRLQLLSSLRQLVHMRRSLLLQAKVCKASQLLTLRLRMRRGCWLLLANVGKVSNLRRGWRLLLAKVCKPSHRLLLLLLLSGGCRLLAKIRKACR